MFRCRSGRRRRFGGQAEFHVRQYLAPLCDEVQRRGGLLFENSRVVDVEESSRCKVVTERGAVHADHVIVATNVPLKRRSSSDQVVALSVVRAGDTRGTAQARGTFLGHR